MMTTVEAASSADGTRIAVERRGDGPPLILIGGAFNDRSTVAALAIMLAPDVTAVTYDRRGRGDSGDGDDYTLEREIEDLAAVIGHAGGSASLFGHSSGGALALEAAQRGLAVEKLAVYEPSYVIEGSRPRPGADIGDRLLALLGKGRRDEATVLFLRESVGVPAEMVEGMRNSPTWGWLTALAHTLPYDVAVCGPGCVLPADRLATITAPTLAIAGDQSPDWLRTATRAVADAIPGARHVTLEGQDHGVLNQPEALRPLLRDFLA
jgi:pimeloyl-ACP methyl ester carboxylesterase